MSWPTAIVIVGGAVIALLMWMRIIGTGRAVRAMLNEPTAETARIKREAEAARVKAEQARLKAATELPSKTDEELEAELNQ